MSGLSPIHNTQPRFGTQFKFTFPTHEAYRIKELYALYMNVFRLPREWQPQVM
jgi:hypothetical protein